MQGKDENKGRWKEEKYKKKEKGGERKHYISDANNLCPAKYPSTQDKLYCHDDYPQVNFELLFTKREELFVLLI